MLGLYVLALVLECWTWRWKHAFKTQHGDKLRGEHGGWLVLREGWWGTLTGFLTCWKQSMALAEQESGEGEPR